MPDEIVKFCEFWDALRDIYRETYPEAYEKYDFPDGTTFLAIAYETQKIEEHGYNIKKAVERGCVSPNAYENILAIISSGKLDDKLDLADKQQIIEDKWDKKLHEVMNEWLYFGGDTMTDIYDNAVSNAKEFVKAVKTVEDEKKALEKEPQKIEKDRQRAEEQKKAQEEAERERQAEFEKKFREEEKYEKKVASERRDERLLLEARRTTPIFLSYWEEVRQREAQRAEREARKLEEEKSWTEEYREEVKRRKEIYLQNKEKEAELKRKRLAEKEEKEKKKAKENAEKEAAERIKLKNDLKSWLDESVTSLSGIKDEMKNAQEQYAKNPESVLEWAKALAKSRAELIALWENTRFGRWEQRDLDKFELASYGMSNEEKSEFLRLIDQGAQHVKERRSAKDLIEVEVEKLPKYIQTFVLQESLDMAGEIYDRDQKRVSFIELGEKRNQDRRQERWKNLLEQHKNEFEAEKQRLAEEAENKRLAEEAKKKKLEEEATKRETLKKDLKELLSDADETLPKIKEDLNKLKEQYANQPDDVVEWIKSMAKTKASVLELRKRTRLGEWRHVDVDELESACEGMSAGEAKDEFRALINRGKSYAVESGDVMNQFNQILRMAPDYVQKIIKNESFTIAEEISDKSEKDSKSRKERAEASQKDWKEFYAQHEKVMEEKKRLQEEERERQHQKEEAEEKARKEREEAEQKRIQEEAAKQARLEKEANIRKEIISAYDAVKDTKDRNAFKSHTKFADMMAALETYKNIYTRERGEGMLSEDDIKRFSDHAYETCIAYLNSHIENGKGGSSLDGQQTPEGRLRKQAVVQILEYMKELPEFKDKPEFQQEANVQEAPQEGKKQPKDNKRERINFNQLKSSLAAKSKIDHQRPYAELERRKAEKAEKANKGPKK